MKVGILTLPLHTNYGGILQAYALQTILKRMGHKVVTFDSPRYVKINIFHLLKKIYSKYVLNKDLKDSSEIGINLVNYFTRKHTQSFIDKNISKLVVSDFSKLENNDYDAIVVGSDQTWRPLYNSQIEDSFLNFTKGWDVKRIAYAASFGTDDWEYSKEQTSACSILIQRFNAVSVREESGIWLCQQYLGYNNVKHLLDPTMLLEDKDYMLFTNKDHKKTPGSLLCYILDKTEKKDKIINSILLRNNLKKLDVNPGELRGIAKFKYRIYPPVEKWLQGFVDAEYVITDSFHGCVFSIIFKKPFWVIGNADRGMARFTSLLKIFGLENRMLTGTEDIANFNFSKPINWISVNKIKKEWQKKSMDYLIANLSLNK